MHEFSEVVAKLMPDFLPPKTTKYQVPSMVEKRTKKTTEYRTTIKWTATTKTEYKGEQD